MTLLYYCTIEFVFILGIIIWWSTL